MWQYIAEKGLMKGGISVARPLEYRNRGTFGCRKQNKPFYLPNNCAFIANIIRDIQLYEICVPFINGK
jgi:hypothetical protein